MRKVKSALFITLILITCLIALPVSAQNATKTLGIRAGVGTDVNGGIAYGAGVNFLIDIPTNALELGIIAFGGSFEESSNNGFHDYHETTDIYVFGVLANYLIGYAPEESQMYYIVGLGLASIGMEWEERSPTDGSLGTLLPGGGSMQSEDGSGGGSVFNLGIGKTFGGNFDARIEVPVILSFAAPGDAAAVIPTVMVTAGLRF